MVNIGLLGLGTVGLGIVEILENRKKELFSLLGQDINIKKIMVKNKDKKRDIDEKYIIVSEFDEILSDEEISIIIEVTGDLENSYEYIKSALNRGKHVVTANKAVVSKYFEELSSLAAKNNIAFLYEASVGGGIPILKPLKEQLALNKISGVQGILNGTCNYILTRMFNEGLDYGEVLKIAQDLGYAEADPSADVEGHDTLRKLRILGTLALQGKIGEEDILLEGINKITSFDVKQIKSMKSTVKLIGEVRKVEDGFKALVQPTIIREDDYFASVNMAYNSVAFLGDNVGELKFYGAGAGKLPTGNAVLSDVLDIILEPNGKNNPLGDKQLENLNEEIKGEYYLRISHYDEAILNSIEDLTIEILCTKEKIALITKRVNLKKLQQLILSLDIKEEEYFLARILD